MGKKIGFIDEYGNKSLHYDKSGVSTFFIITAIVIDKENLEELKISFETIKNKFTQAPELKSKNFGQKDEYKRIHLLKELCKLDFNIYSIVVDKRKIYEDSGLSFQNSFYKYVNKLIDLDLFRYYPDLELILDEHGDESFMNGFIKYIAKEHYQQNLFAKSPVLKFEKSQNEIFIQIADFVSGSLSKVFDPDKITPTSKEILDILKPRVLHIKRWPEPIYSLYQEIKIGDNKFDPLIAEFSVRLANEYVVTHEKNSDTIVIYQVIVLSYLLYRFNVNPYEYVYTNEIINILKQRSDYNLSTQIFRTKIIANLKDKEIIIVSGKNGYKIPCSKSDLINFFNKNNHIIRPMLSRLDRINKLIKIATDNDVDILSIENFKFLSEIIELNKK